MILTFLLLTSLLCFTTQGCNHTSKSPLEGTMFQGDIYLDEEDMALLNMPDHRVKRTAVTNRNKLWPDGTVYYQFGPGYSASDRVLIRSAFYQFHNVSCIRFEEGTGKGDYLFITPNANKGCWSPIGRRGGRQVVSLETPSCMYKGVAMHELMHALGFWHEQARPDRDEYVDINTSNIEPIERPNFMKLTKSLVNTLDQPYDFRSVMHYHAYIFAIDSDEPTIIPKVNGVPLEDLGEGQRTGKFTDIDIAKIRALYQC